MAVKERGTKKEPFRGMAQKSVVCMVDVTCHRSQHTSTYISKILMMTGKVLLHIPHPTHCTILSLRLLPRGFWLASVCWIENNSLVKVFIGTFCISDSVEEIFKMEAVRIRGSHKSNRIHNLATYLQFPSSQDLIRPQGDRTS